MLATSHRSSTTILSSHHGVMDQPGTIDPAALNAPGTAPTVAPNLLSQRSPRGLKRSRSPESYAGYSLESGGDADDTKNVKRNKIKASARSTPAASNMSLTATHQPVQTPTIKTQALPQASPTQASPQRSTPGSATTKPPVVKALPTVRDHTTDQLNPEGDEYIPREVDPDGEAKVSKDGYPLDGRKYKCRTFQVPNRGEKLFMLATECARVLGYRDSYLLFNKNRSLYKIIANQLEKDNLIHQEILPYSYRSRQIAIVTARSMFRQFGSRLIDGGRRVRDDYWQAKARKQGFTEDDPAGEKRPGAARAREQAAAEASHASTLTSLPQGEIIYSSQGVEGAPPHLAPASLAPLPMIHLPGDELRPSALGNVLRPRQEIQGPPYVDRTQASGASEILSQAGQAAEYNKQLGQTRAHRAKYLDDYWRRTHEQPVTEPQPVSGDLSAALPQSMQSPQAIGGMPQSRGPAEQSPHPGSQMISQGYAGYHNQQMNPMPSPVQPMNRPAPAQMHQGSPSMTMGSGPAHPRTPSYGGYPNQMWQQQSQQQQQPPQPQPQPSPLAQAHMSQYGQPQPQHHSPMPPPQMPQQAGMGYAQMSQMGNPAFAGMNRSMYQPSPGPPFNMAGLQSNPGQQPGMQGWSNPGAGSMSQNYGFQ